MNEPTGITSPWWDRKYEGASRFTTARGHDVHDEILLLKTNQRRAVVPSCDARSEPSLP